MGGTGRGCAWGGKRGWPSSYDRSGGNADYSHYEWPEGLVRDEVVGDGRDDHWSGDDPSLLDAAPDGQSCLCRADVLRRRGDANALTRLATPVFAGVYSYFSAPLVDPPCARRPGLLRADPRLRSRCGSRQSTMSCRSRDGRRIGTTISTASRRIRQGRRLTRTPGALSPQQEAARADRGGHVRARRGASRRRKSERDPRGDARDVGGSGRMSRPLPDSDGAWHDSWA